jgi:hypothetical protein
VNFTTDAEKSTSAFAVVAGSGVAASSGSG